MTDDQNVDWGILGDIGGSVVSECTCVLFRCYCVLWFVVLIFESKWSPPPIPFFPAWCDKCQQGAWCVNLKVSLFSASSGLMTIILEFRLIPNTCNIQYICMGKEHSILLRDTYIYIYMVYLNTWPKAVYSTSYSDGSITWKTIAFKN